MSNDAPILLEDVERLATAGAPDLVATMHALVRQGDLPVSQPAPPDLVTLEMLRASLHQASRAFDKKQRQAKAHEAWKQYLAQAEERIAPQIKLADLIVRLYEQRTGPSRQALLLLIKDAPLAFGIWGGIKRVYKRAEIDHDAEIFGALAARFDTLASIHAAGDVKRGTLVYLQRRAWRWLRLFGKAVPELYPQFCVEVLRSYAEGTQQYQASIFSHIQHGWSKKWGAPQGLPKEKTFRPPYRDAWERSPDPLLHLLETTSVDFAAQFAMHGLRELFPETLRTLTPTWLARLAYRPLPTAHDFFVDTLQASPELPRGKLATLGLAEPVLALLLSPSNKARTFAIEYARGHAADMPVDRLVELLAASKGKYADTAKLAAAFVMQKAPRSLGKVVLGRLLSFPETKAWAENALKTELDKRELGEAFFVELLFSGDHDRIGFATKFLDERFTPEELPIAFWVRVLDDPRSRDDNRPRSYAIGRLTKLDVGDAEGDWILGALARDDIGSSIAQWLTKAERLPKGIDLERIKGLVFDPRRRDVAFTLLGNKKLVSAGQVGLPWLLALARRADPALHEWAHRYLLQHMKPEDFAEGKPNAKAGVTRLFGLALGPKEPEAVRTFAQTYLLCHHPTVSKEQPDAKQLHVKPAIGIGEYTMDRVWPALFDGRADVRRFAVTITRADLRRWNGQKRVYELADSSAKEVRRVAYDALSQAGERHADKALALLPEELDAAQIFSMTESRIRSSRDIAIELIRKHYARIGGVERLAWLMQSADREVRFFAVRLLWEKHRPRGIPSDWQPKTRKLEDAGPFKDAEALRALLRRLMFTIPPPRSMEALEGARTRKLPASVAKRSLVAIVRDLALEDAAFAKLVAPVFGEMTGSVAKGEWQACLSALLALRAAHALDLGDVEGAVS